MGEVAAGSAGRWPASAIPAWTGHCSGICAIGHDVVDALVSHVAEPSERDRPRPLPRRAAWARIAPLADELPRQAAHLDLTDANVVVTRIDGAAARPDGVIDFGDLSDTWAVSELAITLSSVLGHPGTTPASILPGIKAFHAIRPLSAAEADALWPLLVLRTAVLIVSGAQQAALDPDNDYVTDQSDDEARMFEQATSVPIDVMTGVIRAELEHGHHPRCGVGRAARSPASTLPSVTTLDLSPTSESYDGAFLPGGWLPRRRRGRIGKSRSTSTARRSSVTRFGEPRPDPSARTEPGLSPEVDRHRRLAVAGADRRRSPPRGRESSTSAGDGLVLRGDELRADGDRRRRRRVRRSRRRRARRWRPLAPDRWFDRRRPPSRRPGRRPPSPPPSSRRAGWRSPATRRRCWAWPPLRTRRARDLLARRDESFARVQEHYYRDPPQIERGWRHFLMSTSGRVYLDMVNNVTVLGHAHPRVADTAARQLRRLNTNSRFNYEAVVEFSERLAATLPEPLDTVFLVNSGSEASDLAVRLATAATGRRDVVAVREAYHGWTYATDAVSTSTADNPNALTTRPDWVHTVESPNSFRGKYRGADAGRYADDAVREIEELVAAGRAPAGFICETVYGNAGGMALPDGYLQQVYAAVRASGGLAIADEVQVGYGRLGEWFWGFHQQKVVPDIVSVAKSVGNGYPLGAVITSRAVAEAFSSQGYFFSSTGGSPLSCAIGLTVLDVLRDEDLQGNAARVGGHLKARLLALRDKHPIIGTVHGMGLYLGVEMIRDPETLAPATEETAAICDRMLELGVVIQPTGDHQNILKTKPPLCIDVDGADFYVDTLDRVLTEGW